MTVNPTCGPAVPNKLLWPVDVKQHIVDMYTANIKRDSDGTAPDVDFLGTLRQEMRPNKVHELDYMLDWILSKTVDPKDGIHWCQGVYRYDQLLDSIKEFNAERRRPLGPNPNYQRALKLLDDVYLHGIRVTPYKYVSDDDILERLPKKDAHAGFTYFHTGKKRKADNVKGALKRLREVKREILEGKLSWRDFPIIPQSRCQSNPPINDDGSYEIIDPNTGKVSCKHKTRLIHMIDFMEYLLMNEHQIPWQCALGHTDWYCGGKEIEHVLWSRIIKTLSKYPYFLVLDASRYDAHLQPWLQYDVRQVKKRHMVLDSEDDTLYDWMTEALIHKLIYDGDALVELVGGEGSGFPSTSTDDSETNVVQVATALFAHGFSESDFRLMVMGDDILICCKREISDETYNSIVTYLWHNFAYKINEEKENAGWFGNAYPKFLSRRVTLQGMRRNWLISVAKAGFPERPRSVYEMKSPWFYGLQDASKRKRFLKKIQNYDPAKRGSDGVDPHLIIQSLILMYPLDMNEIIDVDSYKQKHPLKRSKLFEAAAKGVLPGSLNYLLLYNNSKEVWNGGSVR
jgi:hypothetical protein